MGAITTTEVFTREPVELPDERAKALRGLLDWAENMRACEGIEAQFAVTLNRNGSFDVDLRLFSLGADRVPHGHGSSRLLTQACGDAFASLAKSLEELG